MRWLVLLLLSCLSSQAAQVSWGSEAQSVNLDSTGRTLDATFLFELGAFAPGFIPESTNTDQWAANWTTAARVPYDAANRAVSGPRFNYTTNTAPFLPTNRGWIWGYHPRNPGEWILIGNPSWTWPSASDPFSLPVTWGVISATQTKVGTVNAPGVQMRMAAVGATSQAPALTFAAWQALYFNATERANPAISGQNADPDGDLLSNGVEFLTGTAPRSQSGLPLRIIPNVGVEVSRISGRLGSLDAEVSSNLTLWSGGSAVQIAFGPGRQTFSAVDAAAFSDRAFWRFRAATVE
jgi:hypothetical protein